MPRSIINLRHLRAFVKTYELGTLISAAKAVHITQPAITQGLSRLEDTVGAKLFLRQNDGMRPTDAAKLFYPRAKKAIELIRSQRVTQAQMRAFLAISRDGSYAEASATTGLARASLHRAVTDLEVALSTPLVSKRGRGIEITRTGKQIARRFNLARRELASAQDEIDALKGVNRGRIAIGAMPLCRAKVLPSTIVAFRKRHPSARIFVAEGSHVELVEPLRDGELEILVGALRSPLPGPDLVQTALFDDQPVILARRGHPIHRLSAPEKVSTLARYEWCIPQQGVPLRERWEEMFSSAGITAPEVSIECGSVITIRQILMGSDCLTILSPDQVAVELEAGWLKVVGAAPAELVRTIGITHRAGWRPTALQLDFIESLKAICKPEAQFV